MCQNFLLIEITLATTTCGEGDFEFMSVSTRPLLAVYYSKSSTGNSVSFL